MHTRKAEKYFFIKVLKTHYSSRKYKLKMRCQVSLTRWLKRLIKPNVAENVENAMPVYYYTWYIHNRDKNVTLTLEKITQIF